MSFFGRLEKELLSQKNYDKAPHNLRKSSKGIVRSSMFNHKRKKPDSIRETLIKPAAIAISQIMNGDKVTKEIKRIPLSADQRSL